MAKSKAPCSHCGADCGLEPLVMSDKQFCCKGCEQVYLILAQHNMQSYYSFADNPGIKIEDSSHATKYAFLDKVEVQAKMFDFHEGDIAKLSFYIPSIHCASCI